MLTAPRPHAGVEDTRTRILAAARTLFERNGTRGTTTREVAEIAGVNEATLFRHFGSKRALLDAMREAACGGEGFRAFLASLPNGDVAADLRAIARFTVDQMTARRAMMCISLAEDATATDDAPEWRGPTGVLNELADFLAVKVSDGVLAGDPMLMARCFLGTLFSYVVGRKLWAGAAQDASTLDRVVEVFLNGVAA
jgi:AcrR family transcriptional regulator